MRAPAAGSNEALLEKQWLNFAAGPVASELAVTHDLDGAIFGPLHAGLDRRVFLTGAFVPSLADWLLFSMLHSRIVPGLCVSCGG